DFASGFLQIPPHDGHPCLWLMVPTAKPIADFHRQVTAHAGRTLKRTVWYLKLSFVLVKKAMRQTGGP
ncbi:hypothetical protein, partial [Thermotalea metallivorans]|uniref:hypothetical protein n=1 Tax=Thermotalea metallivorans TaxID=520762 RepID=UPI001A9A5651